MMHPFKHFVHAFSRRFPLTSLTTFYKTMPRGKKTRAQVSAEPSMGPDRSGKTPEDLEEDVKTMADKAGIKMPKVEMRSKQFAIRSHQLK